MMGTRPNPMQATVLRGELNERHEISVVNFQLDAETAKRIGETFLARHQLRESTP
jgi:hypothetical protein